MRRAATLITLAALAGAAAGCAPTGRPQETTDVGPLVPVVEVVDGDTVRVMLDGRRERVRLLGIDAPERTTLRTGHTECGGEAATDALRRLVEADRDVHLVSDPSQGERDQYGRLLAYLDPPQGASFQRRLLEAGWVTTYIRRSNPPARADEFRAAARRARAARAGIWERCGGDFRRPNT